MSNYLKIFIKKHFILLFLLILLISLRIYSLYFTNLTFGDEYDNFTYAWLLKNGLYPYRDFFTHHFPSLIFIGVPLEFIGHSKIIYRIFVMLVTFSLFIFSVSYLQGIWRYASIVFMLVGSFGISLYGGFQYADGTLWSLSLMGGFFIILKKQGDEWKIIEEIVTRDF